MSVSKMEKIHVLGHLSIRDDLLSLLRELGVIEIKEFKDDNIEDGEKKENLTSDSEISTINKNVHSLEYLCSFIDLFGEKEPFFESVLNPKITINKSELNTIIEKLNLEPLHNKAYEIQNGIKKIESNIDKQKTLLEELIPWEKLNYPLEEISNTDRTVIALCSVKKSYFEKLCCDLEKLTKEIQTIKVNETKEQIYFMIAYLSEHDQEILAAIKNSDARFTQFEGLSGTPSEVIKNIKNDITKSENDISELVKKAKEIVKFKKDIHLAYDFYYNQTAKKKAALDLAHTDQTFVVQGWIREKDRHSTIKQINEGFKEVQTITTPPSKEDEPPIVLDNKKITSPFEFVTKLYSNPTYTEYDPTPLLAPFFVIFFAICLTDAGYGITLAFVTGLALKFLKLSKSVKKLIKILFYCGIATGIAGLLTGGWFGIEGSKLAVPLQKFILIDPLKEPLKMLNVAFVLGIVQIFFGIFLKMLRNIKSHDYMSAIFDQLTWIVFLFFLAPLGFKFILGGNVSEQILHISKIGALACLVVVVLTGGRSHKNIFLKPLMGVVKLYDIVGYFGDVLSYARLLALGLATSAIALTVNSVAKMALDLPYYTGYIAAILILIGGHIFNLVLNSLGAFVHSMRLQYLEFFSKFFTGGGKDFKPFKEDRKYSVVLKEKKTL